MIPKMDISVGEGELYFVVKVSNPGPLLFLIL